MVGAYSLEHIVGTNMVIFKDNGLDGKYGIMNFEEIILQESVYDSFDQLIFDNNDCYVIGRIEDQNTTIVFDKDLNIILSGDYGYYEALDEIEKVKEQSYSKTLKIN